MKNTRETNMKKLEHRVRLGTAKKELEKMLKDIEPFTIKKDWKILTKTGEWEASN